MKAKAKYPVAGVPQLREILDEQGFKCALTGRALTPAETTFDHRVALSRGGNSLKENLQAVIKPANRAKADLTQEEFVHLCADVVKTHGATYGFELIVSKT